MVMRVCKICGESFETKSSKRSICYKDHYHPCPVCGKQVLSKDTEHLNNCCSPECTKIAKHKYRKHVCKICGKEFTPHTPNQQYCDNEFIRKCIICGRSFKIKDVRSTRMCCSYECSEIMRKKSNLEKFGKENPAQSEIVKKKQAETNLKLYGATTPFKSKACLEKRRQTMIGKYGTEFAMQNDDLKKKQQKSCKERLGVKTPLLLDKSKQELKAVQSNPKRVREAAIKRAEHRAAIVASDGTSFDSSYEVIVYEFCKKYGLDVKRQIPIKYECMGKSHTTLIDFMIDGQLVECKGYHLLQGIYDYSPGMVPIERKLKVYRDNNVVVVSSHEAKDLLTCSKVPFVDISRIEKSLV